MDLNYKEYGKGEPVVILHGLLGMLDNWSSFGKKLAENYWVILVDQRNHGRSFHSEDFDYNLMSQDLKRLLDHLHIPRAHFIGHSMGGKTVMQFANDYPSMVDKSIVVDIAPKTYEGGHEKIFQALLDIELDMVDERKQVQEQLMKKLNDLSVVLFLMKNLSRNPNGGYRWKAAIRLIYNNYDNIIKDLDIGTDLRTEILFVRGSRSRYIQDEDIGLISKHFSDFRLETIEGAGHWVHADNPEALLELVSAFLND